MIDFGSGYSVIKLYQMAISVPLTRPVVVFLMPSDGSSEVPRLRVSFNLPLTRKCSLDVLVQCAPVRWKFATESVHRMGSVELFVKL